MSQSVKEMKTFQLSTSQYQLMRLVLKKGTEFKARKHVSFEFAIDLFHGT